VDCFRVCVRARGQPFHPDHFSARFERLIADAGLRRIRLHDARHSVASQLLANGTPTKVASEVLGHANVGITMRLYQHVLPGMAEEAIETLSARLLGGESSA